MPLNSLYVHPWCFMVDVGIIPVLCCYCLTVMIICIISPFWPYTCIYDLEPVWIKIFISVVILSLATSVSILKKALKSILDCLQMVLINNIYHVLSLKYTCRFELKFMSNYWSHIVSFPINKYHLMGSGIGPFYLLLSFKLR